MNKNSIAGGIIAVALFVMIVIGIWLAGSPRPGPALNTPTVIDVIAVPLPTPTLPPTSTSMPTIAPLLPTVTPLPTSTPEPLPTSTPTLEPLPTTPPLYGGDWHIVSKGESLWYIAELWYGRGWLWPAIFVENFNLDANPDLIHPGLRLWIPLLELDE